MSSRYAVRAALAGLQFSIGILLAIDMSSSRAEEAAGAGEALYQQRCASCREGGAARAPDRNALRQLSEQRIGFRMLYVNSAYTNYGSTPGNALLAFSVDGK